MKQRLADQFVFAWRDCMLTAGILAAVILLSFLLQRLDGSDVYIPMLFVMAVFLVSRYTNGYLFGMVSAVLGVVLVNFMFTYPYFAFNFTISGYPITFVSMFVTSIMTSTMTTQIKQQEKIRAEAEKEKMRGNLLRAVSHDLRTPLTSIVGTTSALLENGTKLSQSQQQALLRECHDDAEWLIRMVENLLSITRMNGKEARIQKTSEAAEEIVGEAVRKFQKRFPDTPIRVAVPDELLMIPMDAILIEQVLINLLENAVLHGKTQTEIRIMVTKTAEHAVFTVSDNGVGIAESAFAHLFDGDPSGGTAAESDSKRNMGIGLSVCMSIVKAHGGIMTAENQPAGGACFCFSLPLQEGS